MKVTASFIPATWDEKPYGELPQPMKLTRASIEFAFKGGFDGKGLTEYVMFYKEYDGKDPHRSIATYVGLTRYDGTLNGKSGSFVTEDRGTFEGGEAKSVSTILPGSGTGDLKTISGIATSTSTQKTSEFVLEYNL